MTPREVWEPGTTSLARRVLVYERLDSTNRLGLELAFAEETEGLAILAEEQTSGRGQHGRQWVASRGSSVLLSVLLHDLPDSTRPAMLTAWAAVAVCDLVREVIGEEARIKWPNDVLIQGRKVCGILIEQSSRGARRVAVAGIGVNVLQTTEELVALGLTEATSLVASGGQVESREVAKRLLVHLDERYRSLRQGNVETIERDWTRQLGLTGKRVIAEGGATTWRGRLTRLSFAAVELLTNTGSVVVQPEEVRALREGD